MKYSLKKTRALILSLLMLSLTAACTKERPEQFSQGQGTNLLSIADYQNKTFDLATGEELGSANITSASKLKLGTDLKEVNNFSLVAYKTNADLLGDIPFRAKPNGKYQIQYSLTNNYLKVMKVAAKEDIPYDETHYAEQLSDGRLAVPLLGYRILGYYRIEHSKNENNENSNILIEMPEPLMARATHFKVDFLSRTLFQAEEKLDIFPAKLFDFGAEWYYASTLIEASNGNEDAIGQPLNYDEALHAATRIKFVPSDRALRAVNVSVDDRLDKKDEIHFTTAVEIPVEWVEYRARKNGTDTDLSEERVHTNKWSDRPYLKVAFDRATSPSDNNSSDSKLVDIEIAKDFISFTVLKTKSHARIKYAFFKTSKRLYSPKRHFEKDFKLFGFFTTEKKVVQNHELERKEDFERNVFISRFNPRAKEIVFHFSSSSPHWVRDIGRHSIREWNKAFKAAGSSTEIKLDETKDVNLGDIRYNIINIVETLNDGGSLGFGPSINDPSTGEVISATANVYVTPIIGSIFRDLRNYVKSELGLLDANLVAAGTPSISAFTARSSLSSWTGKLSEKIKKPSDLLMRAAPKGKTKFNELEAQAITPRSVLSEIKEKCGELEEYVQELKNQKLTHNAREQSVLNSCARKIALSSMRGTLLHEMGHNFGLRHNFHASNDKENFRPAKETGTPNVVKSSSVMDYLGAGEHDLSILGKYDIAAIRYGYVDQVESSDGQLIDLQVEKSIAQNLEEKSAKMKPYKFCTDEDVWLGSDPMCARWDSGVTPVEVVDNIINNYNALYATHNFRYDRYRGPNEERLVKYKIATVFEPLKRYYDQWRFHLAQHVGLGKEYLDELDSAGYANVLKAMAQDPLFKDKYKEYFPASRRAYQFLTNLAFMPNKYCVVKTSKAEGEELRLLELEKLRDDIYRSSDISVQSCDASASQKYLAEKGLSFVSEIGYHLNNARNNMDLNSIDEPFDIIGNRMDRLLAMFTLVQRSQNSIVHENKKFYPNFLDEPDLRGNLGNMLLPRVGAGLQITSLDPKKLFLKFEYEKDILATFISFFRFGSMVPDKESVNDARNMPWEVYTSPSMENNQNPAAVTKFRGYYFAALEKNNAIALAFINKHKQLVQIKNTVDVNPQLFKHLEEFFQSLPESKEKATVTVKRFKEVLETYMKIAEGAPADAKPHLAGFLNTEIQLYMGLTNYLETLDEEEAKELLEKPLANALNSQGPQFDLYKDTIQGRVNKYVSEVKGAVKLYNNNKSDLDAQIDLIQRIIIEMAGG